MKNFGSLLQRHRSRTRRATLRAEATRTPGLSAIPNTVSSEEVATLVEKKVERVIAQQEERHRREIEELKPTSEK